MTRATRQVLLGITIVLVAGGYGAISLSHLFIELRISISGEEAPAVIVKVEKSERDDGDRSWTEDLINYTFRIPEGYLFSGVNVANESETERLIGRPDATGQHSAAVVEYVPRNPEWHRLKGWGYGGYGPPGGIASFAVRALLHFGVIGLVLAYAYSLFTGVRKS